MIWLYILLVLLSFVAMDSLARRGSRHAPTAGAAAAIAILAIVTGFSIGVFLAPIALALLILAAAHLRHRDRGVQRLLELTSGPRMLASLAIV